LAISPALRGQIEVQPQIEVEGEIDVRWDQSENLVSPFVWPAPDRARS